MFNKPYDPFEDKSQEEIDIIKKKVKVNDFSNKDIWSIFLKSLTVILPIIALISLIFFSLVLLFP